ncbi:MAG: DUF4340 domain-containing protein, partial [Oscillospiraceae bacterium]|nr:DUF4340 domain-containing protein [Oscillospiraceae bacterium]
MSEIHNNQENQEQPIYIAENETTDAGMDTFFADSPISANANQNPGTEKQGMSRNLKSLIAGILVLVILGAALTIILLLGKQQEDAQPIDTDSLAEQLLDDEDKAVLVNPEKSEDLQAIEISNSETFRVYLENSENSENPVYQIEGLEDVNLDTGLISTLVNNASELSANSLVTENIPDSELSKYGLDQPLASVVMHYADGTDFAFSVGNPSPMDNSATYCFINQNLY